MHGPPLPRLEPSAQSCCVCYGCYRTPGRRERSAGVRTINHRELRNNSSEVLRAVAAGEMIEVTNHGTVAAVLVPPWLTPYERLAMAGRLRPAPGRPGNLRHIRRTKSTRSSEDIVADLRGEA